jgi:excisionase family DNA binding protein
MGRAKVLRHELCGQERGGTDVTNEPEKWSSLEEIAEHLGVSKDTIRAWIKKDVIPHRRIGKQYKFKKSEVDAWVDSGESAKIE